MTWFTAWTPSLARFAASMTDPNLADSNLAKSPIV